MSGLVKVSGLIVEYKHDPGIRYKILVKYYMIRLYLFKEKLAAAL